MGINKKFTLGLNSLIWEPYTQTTKQEQAGMATITNWINTFIEEKGIDLEASFEANTGSGFHLMNYGVVVEAIKGAPSNEQEAIKSMLVRIDFKNGSVDHYLRHLGEGLARQYAA